VHGEEGQEEEGEEELEEEEGLWSHGFVWVCEGGGAGRSRTGGLLLQL